MMSRTCDTQGDDKHVTVVCQHALTATFEGSPAVTDVACVEDTDAPYQPSGSGAPRGDSGAGLPVRCSGREHPNNRAAILFVGQGRLPLRRSPTKTAMYQNRPAKPIENAATTSQRDWVAMPSSPKAMSAIG